MRRNLLMLAISRLREQQFQHVLCHLSPHQAPEMIFTYSARVSRQPADHFDFVTNSEQGLLGLCVCAESSNVAGCRNMGGCADMPAHHKTNLVTCERTDESSLE
jgi:hypothetical protein